MTEFENWNVRRIIKSPRWSQASQSRNMFDFLVMNQRSDISQSGSEATAHIDQSESEGVHTVQLI